MVPKKESNYPSIKRLAELQQLIADFSSVLRVPHLANTGRPENDVEHSYGLALTAWYLAPKIAPELNLQKILCYALAHDLVEIYSGDTFPFSEKEGVATKPAREKSALARLRKEWPDFKEATRFIGNYQDKDEEEAVFVYALDKLLPVLMVNLGEKDKFWKRHKITIEMQKSEKQKMLISKHIAPYYDRLVQWMSNPDYYYKAEK